MRRLLVAGNWKMNKTSVEGADLASSVARGARPGQGVDVVLCPSHTSLQAVSAALRGTAIALGAQNAHWEASGAFTGEVSCAMLCELGCRYVIVGHSERRALFGETDEIVRRKAGAVVRSGMCAIVCVGETLEQREAGRTEDVVRAQVQGGLEDLELDPRHIVVAYEPVWAIGTGRHASADQAQEVHASIRGTVESMAGADSAAGVRILYGGSLNPSNAAALFAQPDVDGGLIGGAALDADAFNRIVEAASVHRT